MRFSSKLLKTLKTNVISTGKIFTDVAHRELKLPLIKLRNEPFIPGGSEYLPEYVPNEPKKHFKAIRLNSEETRLDKIAQYLRPYLDDLIVEYPGILVKSLPFSRVEDFNVFAKGLAFKSMDILPGRGYRTNLVDDIYVASHEPKEMAVEPHNEMAYLPISPGKVNVSTFLLYL